MENKKLYLCFECDIETAREIVRRLRLDAADAIIEEEDEKAMNLLKMAKTINEDIEGALK